MPRNPKPTVLKQIHGDRKDRIPVGEPIPASGRVVAPSWLTGEALKHWKRLAPDLIAKRVLTSWDVGLFARYCWLEAHTIELMQQIDVEGKLIQSRDRGLVKNPACQVLRDMSVELIQLAGRYGLTPVDRSKLGTKESDAKKDGADLLSA